MLEDVVQPLGDTPFNGVENWCFQQDSTPTYKATLTQDWLIKNMPDFIEATNWPSSSPDLNPLDYKLWRVLAEHACARRYPNLASLKAAIVKTASEIPLEVIR